MKIILTFIVASLLSFSGIVSSQTHQKKMYGEEHRPQFHFSPPQKWMNDPNGMVYLNGVYHLFYQHYPDSTVWGPMHWAHATSVDLIHWKNEPVALYPDSLGYIFSGSAVVDKKNTTGFGKDGKIPLVAVFTHHDPKDQSEKRENQSIAYSLNEGKTWTKYAGNPVLKNPGIIDFRDPKVMWYEKEQKWVMTLATKDRVTFYSSPNLKEWKKESEFGENVGAHGGVWECPDLFPLTLNGNPYWVLVVSINPGGPNKGSATQYFVGDFNGSKFTPVNTKTKWVDWGADNYAGVTWSNTGNRKIFLGWMSNWLYANVVPTKVWRSAMTIPRRLALKAVGNELFLTSKPVKELDKITFPITELRRLKSTERLDLSGKIKNTGSKFKLLLEAKELADYSIILSNSLGEELTIGFDKKSNNYFIDRSKAGKTSFESNFVTKHTAPRVSTQRSTNLTLLVDVASVEVFADDGLSVMTDICFPNKPWESLSIVSSAGWIIDRVKVAGFKSIWH